MLEPHLSSPANVLCWVKAAPEDRHSGVLEKVEMTRGPLSIACSCSIRVPDDTSASGTGRRLPLRRTRSPDHTHDTTCLGTT